MTDREKSSPRQTKLSSRERDDLLRKGITVSTATAQPELPPLTTQQTQTQPSSSQPSGPLTSQPAPTTSLPPPAQGQSTHPQSQSANKTTFDGKKEHRGYVCEKCKWCDGFEPSSGNKQLCSVCKCDLIFHIDTIEDEDDEDAGEVSSGDEDTISVDEGGRHWGNDSDEDED